MTAILGVLFVLLAVSCLCKSLSTAHAASYTFTTFDVPGSFTTAADGINTAGQIVGFFNAATETHGFLTADGATVTTIDVPGNSRSTDTRIGPNIVCCTNRAPSARFGERSSRERLEWLTIFADADADLNGVFTRCDPRAPLDGDNRLRRPAGFFPLAIVGELLHGAEHLTGRLGE